MKKVFFLFAFALVLPLTASAQSCRTCFSCFSTWDGWTGCHIACRNLCLAECVHASPVMDLAHTYDVGIRVAIHGNNFVIRDILFHSSAAEAGLQPGDQIERVNGLSFRTVDQPIMESFLRSAHAGSVTLSIRRRDQSFERSLERKPVLTMLEEAWISSKPPIEGKPILPFEAGVRVEVRGDRILVEAILPGSPAARAGLKLGDEILSINGQRIEELDPNEVNQMFIGYRANPVELETTSSGEVQSVGFRLQGLTRLVSNVLLLRGD